MNPRAAILARLRAAAEAYGDDLPLPTAGALERPAASPIAAVATPIAAVATPIAAVATPSADVTRPDSGAIAAASDQLELPADLDALRALAMPCRRCKLCTTRTTVVFGEGSPTADVMFVGEAPGAREDEKGRPFVGPAGQLLDRIIENAMGLRREDVYIANVNKCRPPGNRNPAPDEIAACLPFLRAQIRAVRPSVLVTLGRVATHNLLGSNLAMGALRGRKLEYDGIPVVATWHPAYLLREPGAKRETWEDIKRVNRMLGRPEVPS